MELILGSQSSARANLLKEHGIKFEQKALCFDEESLKTTDPKEFVYLACKGKLEKAKKLLTNHCVIVVADSVVSVGNRMQRKAQNKREALEFLKLQNGNEIEVLTCSALISPELEWLDLSVFRARLKAFDFSEVEKYLESGLWQESAGCVRLEDFHKPYIKNSSENLSVGLGLNVEGLLGALKLGAKLSLL
ncbi:septum formation inhibitor Maf [Helicobacter pylori]|uniref:septum formation inhibitor Maf n=1 Tax=Helicobacter pylori TaxID=210 RepID=UPI000D385D60|nr:septum formation inhibitor Maf [Helicobacter pylori]PUD48062.1 septum formation inhibitor Maf [Helicobacter pylori]WRG90899.1 septum formation inhibitor Maf [Helicobacter pylori]